MEEYVGLSSEEVLNNQKIYGLNTIENKKNMFLDSIIALIKEPIIILLLILIIVLFIQKHYIFTIITSILFILITLIHLISTIKLNKILKKNKNMNKTNVKVIRDGKLTTIDSSQVTINDILVLNAGDKVVADAIILKSNDLYVYEEAITKRDTNISKSSIPNNKMQKYKNNYVYSESFISNGNCLAQVVNIGKNTEYYKINVKQKKVKYSSIQRKNKNIINLFYIISLILFIIFTILYDFNTGFGILLCTIIYPLSFINSILIPLTTYKLINNDMIIKDIDTIKKLNRINCICIDKAKIITNGKLRVNTIKTDMEMETLIKHALLSSSLTPEDELEKAIHNYSNYLGLDIDTNLELIKKYPFDKNIKMSASIYKINDENYIFVKGSLESIFDICDISVQEKFNLFKCKDDMINTGLKVIAIASSKINKIEDDIFDYRVNFEGLIGIYDEVIPNIQKYTNYLQDNKIRVVMFTEDNKEISSYIGNIAGIKNSKNVLNSKEINNKKYNKYLDTTNIYSHIKVDDRIKVINHLKDDNKFVAATSCNIETVSSIRNSNVGLSFIDSPDMNKYFADIIFLNNNFGTIVNNIKRVKEIYKNFKKFKKINVLLSLLFTVLSIILAILRLNMVYISIFIVIIKLIILLYSCVKLNVK